MLDDVIDFFTAGVVGLLGWFFGGIDGFVKVLITFSIIDFITGLMAAYTKHELNSSVGFKGICRKISMFCLVGVAHIVDVHMLGDTSMLKTSVTLFYAVNEGISIFENVDVLGIPIPQFLKDRLFNLKEQIISQEHQELTTTHTTQEQATTQELAASQSNDKLAHRSKGRRASAVKGRKQRGQASKEVVSGYGIGNYNVVALDISSHEVPRHHNVTGHSVNGANAINANVAEDSNSKSLDSKEDKEDKEEADTDNADSDDEDNKDNKCVSDGRNGSKGAGE